MKSKSNSKMIAIVCILAVTILVVIDQLTKIWAVNSLKDLGPREIIPNFLSFTYVENSGAAFGIFANNTLLLAIISTIILAFLVYFIFSSKITSNLTLVSLILVVAGGIGNVIDRFKHGYVVDFIDVQIPFLRDFPVFNFADCCVTVGAILLVIAIIMLEPIEHVKEE